jgi:hypothetical protein
MDAWTIFGMVKLFLDIVEGGPSAAVKGILMSGVPYGHLLDVGELVFGLFGLNGGYRGTVVLRQDQYVPLNSIKLLNKDRLTTALAQRNFPELAERQFATMRKREFPKF